MKKLLAAVACLLSTFMPRARAEEWKGIVPLHSTRADVIMKLGDPNLSGDRYELKDETVTILYSDGLCKPSGSGGWNVPKDTVVEIIVVPNEDTTLSDLRLDLSRYVKTKDREIDNLYHYTNEAGGHAVTVLDGLVSHIDYMPAAKDNAMQCAAKTNGP
jgi:hypothetical protein